MAALPLRATRSTTLTTQVELSPMNFLLEIGAEEIPAGYIRPTCDQLKKRLTDFLAEATPENPPAAVKTAATPRRLALYAEGLAERQPDSTVEKQGPSEKIAFDDQGNPTRAMQGFMKGQGVTLDDVELRDTPKGKYVYVTRTVEGRPMADLLAEWLPETIAGLSFPKSMHWVGPETTFARPVRNLVALLDDRTIGFEFAGVRSGNTTPGHPFLAPEPVTIERADFDNYVKALEDAHVVVDVPRRKRLIAERIAAKAGQGVAERFPGLLDEVAQLVEYPNAVVGQFDDKFLELPEPVLTTAMMSHQRYFPVYDGGGALTSKFVTVTNRADDSSEAIRGGNERVLRARLEDAHFFWDEDRKVSLADRAGRLDHVTFQADLGSYGQKVKRVERLTATVADRLGLQDEQKEKAVTAARLSKSDLVTHMVFEFTELQGAMGKEYALAEGLDADVARAIEEHYYPRTAGGELPAGPVGAAVSIADKIDTMVGCFAVGLIPTGSRDPYMLRRFALGIARMALELELSFSLSAVVTSAAGAVAAQLGKPVDGSPVLDFFRDRLYQSFRDAGHAHPLVMAALAAGYDDILDTERRVRALERIADSDNWRTLVAAVERTANITRELGEPRDVDPSLATEEEEKRLLEIYNEVAGPLNELIDQHDYDAAAAMYCDRFAEPLHVFFEKVFVNVDDESVRTNRLSLLKRINLLFSERVADLSEVGKE
jgi:glycyl-tRNA synthetase beta chain